MGRLRSLALSELDAEQRELFDSITQGKRSRGRKLEEFLLEDGGLRGPFNAWLHTPVLGQSAQRLGEAIRYESRLPPNLRELAILTVAATWRAEYEWWAHSRLAREAGVSEETIAALKDGGLPDSASPAERTVHRFAGELMASKRVTDETYRSTAALLGDPGTVELVTTLGYYVLVSMLLNAFQVPLPVGEEPTFSDEA